MSDLTATMSRSRETHEVDVEIGIAAGRTTALLGPNGAGKSTVVAMLAGLEPIDSGSIDLGGLGLDVPGDGVFVAPYKRNAGVVFQDLLLFPHMSVLDNVAFGLERDRKRSEARELAMEVLVGLGVEHLAGRSPASLSGGEAQLVALARALAPDPAYLLLDEPLSALDVATRGRIRRILGRRLAEFAGPRLLVTHDPADAFILADEILIMEEGRVTQRGTAEEIRLRPSTPYAAEVGGANLLSGTAEDGVARIATHEVQLADSDVEGEVLVVIQPSAVSIHVDEPVGSQRNVWQTTVDEVARLGDRARIRTGPPIPLTVEVTSQALDQLNVDRGKAIWVAIKATEIDAFAID